MDGYREANERAIRAMTSTLPLWVGVAEAIEVVPGMSDTTILHAGPPIAFSRMTETMQGAIVGAILFEGLAATPAEARSLAESGRIDFDSNHDHASVLPMCGVLSAHMPVCVVEDAHSGRRAYTSICDDDDGGIKFGGFGPEALESVRWAREAMLPCFREILSATGPVDLARIMNEALDMGDDLHLRTEAAGIILVRELLTRSQRLPIEVVKSIVEWGMRRNSEHFLNFAMAACKIACDAASGIEDSCVVTAISRNGVEAGIKIAAFPDRWFTAPSPEVSGVYREGYSAQDASRDIGDSAIMEVLGFGGGILDIAPVVAKEVDAGKGARSIVNHARSYGAYTSIHPYYHISIDAKHGLPIGIDVSQVARTGSLPLLTTAIAHKQPGHPQIGVGTSVPPAELYEGAWEFFRSRMETKARS